MTRSDTPLAGAPTDTGRRTLLATALTLLLGACATGAGPGPVGQTGQAAVLPREVRQQALRELGFVESGDDWEMNLSVKLLFDTDSSDLSPAGLAEIARIAPVLERIGIEALQVVGYTDNVGQDDYNRTLSFRRARTVSDSLRRNGLAQARIHERGMGKAHPVASNETAEGRQQNRRVALIVSGL